MDLAAASLLGSLLPCLWGAQIRNMKWLAIGSCWTWPLQISLTSLWVAKFAYIVEGTSPFHVILTSWNFIFYLRRWHSWKWKWHSCKWKCHSWRWKWWHRWRFILWKLDWVFPLGLRISDSTVSGLISVVGLRLVDHYVVLLRVFNFRLALSN